MLPSTQKFVIVDSTYRDQLRLGQRFVNMYIKCPWPELFYEDCVEKAKVLINKWLKDNQYVNDLPRVINWSNK